MRQIWRSTSRVRTFVLISEVVSQISDYFSASQAAGTKSYWSKRGGHFDELPTTTNIG
jgi:hypothetical protein